MTKGTAVWFGLAGAVALHPFAIPRRVYDFYHPNTALDFVGVGSTFSTGLVAAVALFMLWRKPPVRRGAVLIPLAAIFAIVMSVGQILEFSYGTVENIHLDDTALLVRGIGAVGLALSLLISGVAALTVDSQLRWSGIFLILVAAFGVYPPVGGPAAIAFSIWLYRQVHQTAQPKPQST